MLAHVLLQKMCEAQEIEKILAIASLQWLKFLFVLLNVLLLLLYVINDCASSLPKKSLNVVIINVSVSLYIHNVLLWLI